MTGHKKAIGASVALGGVDAGAVLVDGEGDWNGAGSSL